MSTPGSRSPILARSHKRRQIDLEIMVDWIRPGSRVLDLGCGRGVLLDELRRRKEVYGVGVDLDPEKVGVCIRKGLNIVQGDVAESLARFQPDSFDYVVFSRTLEMIGQPATTLGQALALAPSVLVGAINRGFWKNRWSFLSSGRTARNEVYPFPWEDLPLTNHLSVAEFLTFVRRSGYRLAEAVYLSGDWETRCRRWVSWRAGYAIFHLQRPGVGQADG